MCSQNKGRRTLLFVLTSVPGALLAAIFLLLGVINLVSPQVAERALAQNTRICAVLILTAVVLVYAMCRNLWGGYALGVCSVLFAFVFGFHPFFLAVAGLLLLLGVMFITLSRQDKGASRGEERR